MIINFCFILLLAIGFGQNEARIPADFPTLQKMSVEELKLKTEAHKETWGLDKITRWDLTHDSGELVFSLPDGMKAVSPAQIIGTYNSEDHTWLWAWANPSIAEKLKVDALKVRKYGEEHHIDQLTKRKWVGTEDDAWAMTALAVKLCGAQGAYRGPAGSTYVFIAFGEVKLSKASSTGPAIPGYQNPPNAEDIVYSENEVDIKAEISNLRDLIPSPARECPNNAEVKLTVILRKSRKVTDVKIVKAANCSLDAKAIQSVKRAKFKPAEKDGVAVSQLSEFSFKHTVHSYR